jgi:tRNA(Ile)-lysidine synthase
MSGGEVTGVSRETDPLWSQVLSTIRRYDMLEGAGSTGLGVVVGASGGPDSTALVHALAHLAPQLGLTLHVAHLNHGFRGEEAAGDAEYARGLAAALGLGFTADFADVPAMARRTGLSAPAAAREARYAFFRAVAAAVGATCVAVGHTLDDQAETVLMRLARGAGVEGLSGMPAVRDDRGVRIIRPLIRTRRAEVEAYCARHGLAPRRDSSNEKPLYLRNRLRLEAMPVLHRLEPAFSGNAARTAEILAAENEVMSAAAQAAFRRAVTGDGAADDRAVRLSRKEFLALPTALQRRVVRLAYGRAGRDPEELDFEHVESARLAAAGPSGRRIGLGRGVEMSTEHACLVFQSVHTGSHTHTPIPAPAPA